jgi:hypothetical protein
MPAGGENYHSEGEGIAESDVIPTTRWHRMATTELERFDIGTSDINRYKGKNDGDADMDEEDAALQPFID